MPLLYLFKRAKVDGKAPLLRSPLTRCLLRGAPRPPSETRHRYHAIVARTVDLDYLVGDVATAVTKVAPRQDMAPPKPLTQVGELAEQANRSFCLASVGPDD
jgi:hypothetical protein